MTRRGCTVDACDRSHYGRGLCSFHYQRWFRRGDPNVADQWPVTPVMERILGKIEIDVATACWRFTGAHTEAGYGRIGGPRAEGQTLTHRAVYEFYNGPVPEGLELDHVWDRGCRHKDCCNPDHLEAVTRRENTLRGFRARLHERPGPSAGRSEDGEVEYRFVWLVDR